jgi:hypothetical protein
MARNILDNLLGALSKAKRQLESEAKKIADQIGHIETLLSSAAWGARKEMKSLGAAGKRSGRRKISAAGRARIAAAQRKRWAKVRAAKKTS